MTNGDGLICAYILDGKGGGHEVDWSAVKAWSPEQGILWVHLVRDADDARHWLQHDSGLLPIQTDALLEEETRPRSLALPDGLLVILRGVNLNPGADAEDMVGLRIWAESNRIITARKPRLMAIQDIRETLDSGRGPSTVGTFLAAIAIKMTARMSPVIADLEDRVDGLEDELLTTGSRQSRLQLQDIRRQAIRFRRYLYPQKDALAHVIAEDFDWFDRAAKSRFREALDRTLRFVEDLDEVRDRAAVVQDELMNRLAERMNRTMYALTVVAAVMLPLSFVTGLLGINVGGIPGGEVKWAFWGVCGLLAVLAAVQIWAFRKLKWI